MYLDINPQISKFCELSGYSEDAVRTKIKRGIWQEGKQYVKAPDGHIKIILEGVKQWDEGKE